MEPLATLECEYRLCLPNHALIVGATQSGKTRLVVELLGKPDCFHPRPSNIYFYYSEFQKAYLELQKKLAGNGIQLHLRQGSDLTLKDIERTEGQAIYVIDDATEATASSTEIAQIATNARHRNASLWLIWHSLFSKHPASRIISQNAAYYFFLPSPRLASQLRTLDSQLGYKGKLVDAYAQATSQSPDDDHRYLLVNLTPHCDPKLRLRSHVHHRNHQYVYLA